MSNLPRPYRDECDLEPMCALLVLERRANNGSYYVHPGDLDWWLHHPPQEEVRKQTIFLWESNANDSHLPGWTLLSPEWSVIGLRELNRTL